MSNTRKSLHSKFGPLNMMQVRPQRPAKEIVAEQMVARKSFNYEQMRVKGRFSSHAELIAYLNNELAKGGRSHSEIASDARVPPRTLTYLIYSGKVQKASSGAGPAKAVRGCKPRYKTPSVPNIANCRNANPIP